jgi:hypothetical protein
MRMNLSHGHPSTSPRGRHSHQPRTTVTRNKASTASATQPIARCVAEFVRVRASGSPPVTLFSTGKSRALGQEPRLQRRSERRLERRPSEPWMWVGLSRQHRAAPHLRRHHASRRRAVPGRTVTQTRSANRSSSWRATARARRVLLMPPAPVKLTSRCAAARLRIPFSSSSRPTSSAGALSTC